jgi:hypothetical protein
MMTDYSLDKNNLKSDCTKAQWHTPEITEMDYSETDNNVFAGGDGTIGANS